MRHRRRLAKWRPEQRTTGRQGGTGVGYSRGCRTRGRWETVDESMPGGGRVSTLCTRAGREASVSCSPLPVVSGLHHINQLSPDPDWSSLL